MTHHRGSLKEKNTVEANLMENIVIIGGNAAGMTAASRARRLDPRIKITVLEKGPTISYSTCGIPYLLSGLVPSDNLITFTPEKLKHERNIDAHVHVRVDQIQVSRRRVLATRLDTGEETSFGFDRLLIATGVQPSLPDIPGTDLEHVFPVTTLEGALKIKKALRSAERIGIVGGGYVGLELAESLRTAGKNIILFEQQPHVLSATDPDMARIIEYELLRHGVVLRTASKVQALVGSQGRVTGIKALGNLGIQPVDLVLLDTGVSPNTDLAEEVGIKTGTTGGITVDEYLETNIPSIFAAGNCAETYCQLRERPVLHHLGTVAAKQGRVAGENLVRKRSKYGGSIGTTILKVFELGVGMTGLNSVESTKAGFAFAAARVETYDRASYYPGTRKIWIKLIADRNSRKLIGAQAAGYGDVSKRIDIAATAITAGMKIDEVSGIDLGYSPPYGSLWDPLHVAAQALIRQL